MGLLHPITLVGYLPLTALATVCPVAAPAVNAAAAASMVETVIDATKGARKNIFGSLVVQLMNLYVFTVSTFVPVSSFSSALRLWIGFESI